MPLLLVSANSVLNLSASFGVINIGQVHQAVQSAQEAQTKTGLRGGLAPAAPDIGMETLESQKCKNATLKIEN